MDHHDGNGGHGGGDHHADTMDHSGHEDHSVHSGHQDTPASAALPTLAAATVAHHGVMNEMMQMTFHFGTKEKLLFDFWNVDSTLGMVASCALIFVLASSYEGIRCLRGVLAHRERRSRYSAVRTVNGVAGSTGGTPEEEVVVRSGMLSVAHAQQTGLYVVQLTLAYLLMLLFMCFNVWVCLAVVLGAGVGHFLFGWYRVSSQQLGDHCTA